MSEKRERTADGLLDRGDALLVVWLAVRAVLVIAAAAVAGLAIRVLIWTSGLGG